MNLGDAWKFKEMVKTSVRKEGKNQTMLLTCKIIPKFLVFHNWLGAHLQDPIMALKLQGQIVLLFIPEWMSTLILFCSTLVGTFCQTVSVHTMLVLPNQILCFLVIWNSAPSSMKGLLIERFIKLLTSPHSGSVSSEVSFANLVL